MTSILVWVLVACGGYNGNLCSFSPQHATKESCEFMQKQVGEGKCVGMYVNKDAK